MSRDGYERWDDQAEAGESGPYESRRSRGSRRTAAREDSWPPGSRPGQGSGEWPEEQSGSSPPWQPGGYDPATYTDPGGYGDSRGQAGPGGGYADSRGYAGQGGYPDSGGYASPGGYGNSGGYPAPGGGYPDAGGYPGSGSYPGSEPGSGQYSGSGGHSRRALPAGGAGSSGAGSSGAGSGSNGHGYPENSYPESRYSGGGSHSPYADSGYQGGDGRGYSDGDYPGGGYPDNGYADQGYDGYGNKTHGDGAYGDGAYGDGAYGDGAYGDGAYGGRTRSGRGYFDPGNPAAGYPGDEYPGSERDPYARPDPYRADPAGRSDSGQRTDPSGRGARRGEPDYGVPDGYGTPGSYGEHDEYGRDDQYAGYDQYGGRDQYGAPAGYRTSDAYPALDAYSQPGAGRGAAGYDASAAYEHGGGYDDNEYGSAPPARGPDGAGGRGARDDEAYGWQEPVDDSGVTRRRRRGSEDEIDADSARHNGFFRGFGGGDDDYGHRPPKRRRSRAPIVALTVVIVFLVAVVGGGVYAYKWYSKRHADWVGSTGYGSVLVQVKPGEFACSASLESRMVSLGVVASETAFCDAAKNASDSSSLEPGYFRLHKHMGAALAWKLLISPKSRVEQKVTVPDGLRASLVLAQLAKGTGIALSQFQAALKDTSALGLPSWAKGNPEGFLYPATYNIQPGATALSILKMMVAQFNSEVTHLNLAAGARKAQFSEYQIITEASLLEGEVGPTYFKDVARVIDNRLNQVPPMDLGLDSTVAYATDHYIYNLTQSDLNVNSPYNTFKHAGLPPGPIDSPDAAAIEAALHPNDSAAARTWLYFVTVNKAGLTKFTASEPQFETWSNEAKQNGV